MQTMSEHVSLIPEIALRHNLTCSLQENYIVYLRRLFEHRLQTWDILHSFLVIIHITHIMIWISPIIYSRRFWGGFCMCPNSNSYILLDIGGGVYTPLLPLRTLSMCYRWSIQYQRKLLRSWMIRIVTMPWCELRTLSPPELLELLSPLLARTIRIIVRPI